MPVIRPIPRQKSNGALMFVVREISPDDSVYVSVGDCRYGLAFSSHSIPSLPMPPNYQDPLAYPRAATDDPKWSPELDDLCLSRWRSPVCLSSTRWTEIDHKQRFSTVVVNDSQRPSL